MTSTKEKLMGLTQIQDHLPTNKVSIIGCGQVGMAIAYSLICQGVCNELALSDVMEDKLKGECMDLRQGLAFMKNMQIEADKDPKVTANSKIIVITAGVRQKPGESRLSLVQRNTDIYKGLIPKLVEYSPNAIFLVVSNPVDVLTYVTWKLSGLPVHRIIGSGTNLDSARFRHYIGEKLGIAATSCHAWIVGEHGDSSVAVWSGVNVAGVNLTSLNPLIGTPEDPEKWEDIHKQVIQSAYDIINLKGYTSWAIGLSVSTICQGILRNEKRVFALSTYVKNWHELDRYGITEDVFFSLPCIVGHSGILTVLSQNLSDQEVAKLKNSAKTLDEVQKGIQF